MLEAGTRLPKQVPEEKRDFYLLSGLNACNEPSLGLAKR
jgi:hypothetical protein